MSPQNGIQVQKKTKMRVRTEFSIWYSLMSFHNEHKYVGSVCDQQHINSTYEFKSCVLR